MVANSVDRFNGLVASLALKAPCIAVALTDITLSAEQTVNGVAVVADDRVLVIGQTDPVENGIYNASTSAWQRAADFDGNRDVVKGTIVTVSVALAGKNPMYKITTDNPITIGTSDIDFARFDGQGIAVVEDEDSALDVFISYGTLQYTTALTANRTVTLSATRAKNGDKFRIVRTGLGSFTLDVDGLKTIPSATAAFVDVEFNGGAWVLTGYGAL